MCEGLKDFIRLYDVEECGKYIILYKTVGSNYTSYWSLTGSYKPGTLVKLRSRPVNKSRYNGCGVGLHAATAAAAYSFNRRYMFYKGKFVKVAVKKSDVKCVPFNALIPTYNIYMRKIRCSRLQVLEEISAAKIKNLRDKEVEKHFPHWINK